MCPVVTVDPNDFERFLLKSALKDPHDPNDEDGYVYLRPLPYGMKITRSDRALRMSMRQTGPQDHKKKNEGSTIDLETAREWTTQYDFGYCIGDHNLTDKNKVKIDFKSPMAVKLLNPRVGTEIEMLIDKLNEDEDTDAEDLVRRAISSSDDHNTQKMDLSTPVNMENKELSVERHSLGLVDG